MTPRIQSLQEEQWVPVPLGEVFSFFADPANLAKVTPPEVGFRSLTKLPVEMKEGLLLEYRISVRGIPMYWSSKITEWNPPHHFTDEQVRGPYTLWRHRHSFTAVRGGTLITDHVEYAAPFSWLPGSQWIDRFFIRPELTTIFTHRRLALRRQFNLPDEDPGPLGTPAH